MFMHCKAENIKTIYFSGMCQVSGYGHYHTFDNYDYDFAGTCSYTLVKDCWSLGSIYMVTIENAACGMEGASCVKAVVLEDGMNVVRLRRGHQVLINGQEVTEFPKTIGNIFVNQPTEHQTAVSYSYCVLRKWNRFCKVKFIFWKVDNLHRHKHYNKSSAWNWKTSQSKENYDFNSPKPQIKHKHDRDMFHIF